MTKKGEGTYSSKRIIKNTFFLYIRMLLILGVNLYVSRLVLEALGVDDFGLYNIVGGIVVLFTIVNSALSSGSSRFLTFELGRGDQTVLRKTFSASFIIHSSIAVLILLLTETVGLWYVNNYLVIPDGRLAAANWVYQFSILSCMLSLTQVPYSAIIIAHEKMNVYAGVSIAEAVYKLLLVFTLLHITAIDRLILYAIMICAGSLLIQLYYRFYCTHKFRECRLILVKDKSVYKRMLSFSLWDVMGAFTVSGNSQGINILINYFFGVVVNAARGIAYQVEGALTLFSNNFMTAVKPQIVKLFAEGQRDKMISLVFESSKYCYFLLYVIAMPVLLETDYILGIWLKTVPEYTSVFLRCIIIAQLIRSFAKPVIQAVHASGNIKWLNIFGGGISILLQIPLTFIFYKMGYPAVSAFIIMGVISIICNFIELFVLKNQIPFSIVQYLYKVYLTGIAVSLISLPIPLLIYYFFRQGFLKLLLICAASVILVGFFVFIIGINSENKKKILETIKQKIQG